MKKIIDNNFTHVFCCNRIITISNATGEYAVCSVGQRTATGHVLTQDDYDRMLSEVQS